ncbi:MAG: hypothetical protein KatS3mg022_2764 [Armatimonadota bacterium]|nr:MAG: hypothetical protein KatS3mg022_2764 [Armatimonadota bacterium]
MKRQNILSLSVIAAVSVTSCLAGCAKRTNHIATATEPLKEADFCSVTRLCSISRDNSAEQNFSQLFRRHEAAIKRLKGIDATLRCVQTEFVPVAGRGDKVTVRRDTATVRCKLDIEGRRYQLTGAKPGGGEAFFESVCNSQTCAIVKERAHHDSRSPAFAATIAYASNTDIRTSVLQAPGIVHWLEALLMHRVGPLNPAGVVGEGWLGLWQGHLPDPKEVSRFSFVGNDVLPGFGICYVYSLTFSGSAFRGYRAWLWFTDSAQCVRSVEMVEQTNMVYVLEVKNTCSNGTVSIPQRVVRSDYVSARQAGQSFRSASLSPLLTVEVTLSDVLLNPEWKVGDFQIELPANTLVSDERYKRVYLYRPTERKGYPLWLAAVLSLLFILYLWHRMRINLGKR